jgi:hypothetical protein
MFLKMNYFESYCFLRPEPCFCSALSCWHSQPLSPPEESAGTSFLVQEVLQDDVEVGPPVHGARPPRVEALARIVRDGPLLNDILKTWSRFNSKLCGFFSPALLPERALI